MKNDQRQIHFDMSEFFDQSDLKFNVFYTATKKDVDVQYNVYDAAGKLLGKGNFTLDGDKVVSKIDDITQTEDNLIVYPNPTSQYLNIKTNGVTNLSQANYKIVDSLGKTVGSGDLSNENDKINVSGLISGGYILIINLPNGDIISNRFLKIKM